MPDTEKDLQTPGAETADRTPPPADPSQVLSPRRRSALVTYLAILFAIAFLFVAVTMALEAKRLKLTNEALKDSSQKTSASLTGSIDALQRENQQLSKDNDELTARIAALQAELEASETKKEEYSQLAEELNGEKTALEEEKVLMTARIEELVKKAEDAVTVSELLQSAIAANEAGDLDQLVELLNQIAPLRDSLSPSEKDVYESLFID